MHILLPETDNCPSWISGRERITVENISWSISTKECCRPRRELNPRTPGLQLDGASNWATEAGSFQCKECLVSIYCYHFYSNDDSAFCYIWSFVYTVCRCPFHVMLGMNKLIFLERCMCGGGGGGGLGGSWNLTTQSTSLRSCHTGKWVNKVLSITLL